MLSQMVYWSGRCSDGWFYKTMEEWEEETGLTRREQETARKILTRMCIVQEDRKGVPARLHFHVDQDALREHLRKIPSRQTRLAESAKLDERKEPSSGGGKRQTNTETTRDHAEKKASVKPKRTLRMTDEEFIDSLKFEEAYAGIDIDREHQKAQVWCKHKGKQCTQNFFINWLNKADKPLSNGKNNHSNGSGRESSRNLGTCNEGTASSYAGFERLREG